MLKCALHLFSWSCLTSGCGMWGKSSLDEKLSKSFCFRNRVFMYPHLFRRTIALGECNYFDMYTVSRVRAWGALNHVHSLSLPYPVPNGFSIHFSRSFYYFQKHNFFRG